MRLCFPLVAKIDSNFPVLNFPHISPFWRLRDILTQTSEILSTSKTTGTDNLIVDAVLICFKTLFLTLLLLVYLNVHVNYKNNTVVRSFLIFYHSPIFSHL